MAQATLAGEPRVARGVAGAVRAAGLRLALLVLAGCLWAGGAAANGPSFDCGKAEPGSVEALICSDDGLAELDVRMAEVYAAAARKAVGERPSPLKAEQRGWIKDRNDCQKSDDRRQCAADSYRLRIAELQARYGLVPAVGTARFTCGDDPYSDVAATFYPTDPPTLRAVRGRRAAVMYLQRGGSGARYQGRDVELRERQGEALITWGPGAPQERCAKAP
ncbi:MAG: MliC family protein [Thermodesulfobacteriota bacterium]